MSADKYTVIVKFFLKKKAAIESCFRKFFNNIYKEKQDPRTMSYLR